MRRRALHFAVCCGLLAVPAAQASVPTLYHPMVGLVDPGIDVPTYAAADRTLDLVLAPGTVANSTGTVCQNGNGDEVCGFYVEIEVDGDLAVDDSSFVMASLAGAQVSDHGDGRTVRIAIVTTATPLTATPTLIGTLNVQSGTSGGTVRLTKLQTVDASLDLMPGTPRDLAILPEPGVGSQLGAGALALAWLARRRARRGGVR